MGPSTSPATNALPPQGTRRAHETRVREQKPAALAAVCSRRRRSRPATQPPPRTLPTAQRAADTKLSIPIALSCTAAPRGSITLKRTSYENVKCICAGPDAGDGRSDGAERLRWRHRIWPGRNQHWQGSWRYESRGPIWFFASRDNALVQKLGSGNALSPRSPPKAMTCLRPSMAA